MRVNFLICAGIIVLLLLCISAPLTGVGVLSYRIHNSRCTIEAIGHRNCYEQKAQITLEQYITINGNRSAFIHCGPVLHCETSPCEIGVEIGKQYWCYLYNDNGLYKLDRFVEVNFTRILWLCICLVIFCFVVRGGVIFFNYVLPETPMFKSSSMYAEIPIDDKL